MKKWLFLVCATILFRPVFPVVEYALRYDYISQELCVNKDKPALHCNGKCYLMKRLAAAAESEKPATPEKKSSASIELIDLFLPNTFVYDLSNTVLPNPALPSRFCNQILPEGFVGVVFHPPAFFC